MTKHRIAHFPSLTFAIVKNTPKLRFAIVILLFVSILAQSMNKALIVLNYQINKDYITKNLCENRNKPAMKCNGKCHLRKQLAGDDQNKNSNSRSQEETSEVILFFHHTDLKIHFIKEFITKQIFFSVDEFISLDYIRNIFHPPSGSFSF